MIRKRGPIILLILLVLILFFILGVRYGQRVEKTNKVINYLISLPPTQTPQPTQKPTEFKKYVNKACGVEFLYLSQFSKLQESSEAASIGDINRSIGFLCNKNEDKNYNLITYLTDPQTATAEITLQDKEIEAKSLVAGAEELYIFDLRNPYNGKTVYFGVSKSLYPLFDESFEFIR
ncbi:hypothetical protein HYW87_02910 [Candidatus Roizmanbacteria bacterium]|nr:hypothetical protein [Candidatus Roizmanbacteria bacterium]